MAGSGYDRISGIEVEQYQRNLLRDIPAAHQVKCRDCREIRHSMPTRVIQSDATEIFAFLLSQHDL